MSINQKRAVLIFAGLLILVCTFFLLYQPNTEKVMEIEQETSHYRGQISYLSALQIQVNQMNEQAPAYQKEMSAFMKKFPSRMTQPKAIYNVYRMMVKTGIHVRSIAPGVEQTFYNAGDILSSLGGGGTASGNNGTVNNAAAATPSAVEAAPETEVAVHEMIGKFTPYELTVSGTYKQIKKALDWISKNNEHMSTTNISLTYDSSTGKLSGTIMVNYFAMNGNGVPYEEPDISGILIGSKNIFGTVK